MGRTACEILIPDGKVSNTHAQIEKDQKGRYILMDLDSSNGLLVNGVRVKRIALLPGVMFQAGKTFFKVIDQVEENVVIVPKEKREELENTPEKHHWRDVLTRDLLTLEFQNQPPIETVLAFRPLIKLNFISGIQADQTYVLGYGPRQFGADGLDIELMDPAAPSQAFELSPGIDGVRFTTSQPEIVLLNNKSVSTDLVKTGDRIYLGQTIIQVSFEE